MKDRFDGLYEWIGVPFAELEPEQAKVVLARHKGGQYAPHVLALHARIRDLKAGEGFRAGSFTSKKAAESFRTCAGNAVRKMPWCIADDTKKVGKYPYASMLVYGENNSLYVDFVRTR